MKAPELVKILAEAFGPEKILVHTEYHIQVVINKKPHDVWLNNSGSVKWKLYGSRRIAWGHPPSLIDAIKRSGHSHTDLGNMESALLFDVAIRWAEKAAITSGVFCDAGFKDQKARISVVKIDGEIVDAFAMPVVADNIAHAEKIAISVALTLHPDFTVYSDAQTIVEAFNNPRVKWVPREKNRTADQLANLRK